MRRLWLRTDAIELSNIVGLLYRQFFNPNLSSKEKETIQLLRNHIQGEWSFQNTSQLLAASRGRLIGERAGTIAIEEGGSSLP